MSWRLIPLRIPCTFLVDMGFRSQLKVRSHTLFDSHCCITGRLNDLWKFNLVTLQWTWVTGNTTVNVNGVYGDKGGTSSSNYPGSRSGHAMVLDSSRSVLIVFGGWGFASNGQAGKLMCQDDRLINNYY